MLGQCGREIARRMQDEAVRFLLSFPPSSGNLLAYVKMHRESVGTAWGMPRLPYPTLPRHSERQRREESSNIPFALSFLFEA